MHSATAEDLVWRPDDRNTWKACSLGHHWRPGPRLMTHRVGLGRRTKPSWLDEIRHCHSIPMTFHEHSLAEVSMAFCEQQRIEDRRRPCAGELLPSGAPLEVTGINQARCRMGHGGWYLQWVNLATCCGRCCGRSACASATAVGTECMSNCANHGTCLNP